MQDGGAEEEVEVDGCVICLETIAKSQSTWQCRQCFSLLHLGCIRAWIAKKEGPQKFSAALFPELHHLWTCPKCRAAYSEVPERYWCFCGKTDLSREQEIDHFREAHSCGEICGKQLADCEHTCTLLCHRSACPSCSRMMPQKCFCGAETKMLRCGLKSFSCEARCGKRLPCGHACEQSCHEGDCQCRLQSMRSCMCNKQAPVLAKCSDPPRSCGAVCDAPLPCGVHRCTKVCHSKEQGCDICLVPSVCPCGKTKYGKLQCGQPVPPCNNVCRKPLQCGHFCDSMCHQGACPPCQMRSRERQCHCGGVTKMLPCDIDFSCSTRCNQVKNCGRHKCSKKCCTGCNKCTEICGEKLNCLNHRCEAFCHAGPCQDCTKMVEIRCACGRTTIRIKCGLENSVPPPRCKLPCSYVVCHHQPNHPCHFGECKKSCTKVCGKQYEKCPHQCQRSCHDPIYPYVPKAPIFKLGELFRTKVDRKEEMEAARAFGPRMRLPIEKVDCPPCAMVVKRQCVGKHETFDKVCSTDPVFSCDRACGGALLCENHTCPLPCHNKATSECRQCPRKCSFKFSNCPHVCRLDCHPKTISHPTCVERCFQNCYCGAKTIEFECFQTHDEALVHERRQCGGPCPKNKSCGHRCSRTCHEGVCETSVCIKGVAVSCSCREKRTKLKCDEVLALRKSKKLAFDSTAVLECDENCVEAARLKREAKEKEEEAKLALRQQGKKRDAKKTPKPASAGESSKRKSSAAPSFLERTENVALLAALIALVLFLLYAWVHYKAI